MSEYLGYLALCIVAVIAIAASWLLLVGLGVILREFLGLVLFLWPLILGGVIASLLGSESGFPVAVAAIVGQIAWGRYWFRNITW